MIGSEDDLPEVQDLEATAEWRLRKVDADPTDRQSAAAAQRMQDLAEELRGLETSPLFNEYRAICAWLDEFQGMEDFAAMAHAYRRGIGFTHHPENAEAYLQALLVLAKETFGTP
ncbi:MAG: hypothetical protein P4L71_12830 [Acetobacteraceae bacterium]|nr:hypothetical protein [Acetobacteraceae bacterium]